MNQELKPCPFCGAGKTDIHPNGRIWTGERLSNPVSVSIRHWCEDVAGQPHRMIERIGRDEASAIEAWNTRAALAAPSVPSGEPVAWMYSLGNQTSVSTNYVPGVRATPLYATPQPVPAGWRLMPVEPTEAMIDATYHGQPLDDIWRDMVAAAPGAPDAQKGAI